MKRSLSIRGVWRAFRARSLVLLSAARAGAWLLVLLRRSALQACRPRSDRSLKFHVSPAPPGRPRSYAPRLGLDEASVVKRSPTVPPAVKCFAP